MILPFIKYIIKIGPRVIESIAPQSIANVFVKASGENSFPSCPLSSKIGKNDTTTKSRAKKIGRPTCFAEDNIISVLYSFVIFSFP